MLRLHTSSPINPIARYLFHCTGLQVREDREESGDQPKKIRKAVRLRAENDNSQGPAHDVLLVWNAFVDGDECVEATVHGIQEVTVVEVAPAHLGGGSDLVTWQALANPPW